MVVCILTCCVLNGMKRELLLILGKNIKTAGERNRLDFIPPHPGQTEDEAVACFFFLHHEMGKQFCVFVICVPPPPILPVNDWPGCIIIFNDFLLHLINKLSMGSVYCIVFFPP